MRKFMNEDFLLTTHTGKKLFRDYAEKSPIIDCDCGLSVKDIFEQRKYENLTQLLLETDDAKLDAMRRCGVEEFYITGVATDYDKFLKFAEILPGMIGSPIYHWTHLELQRYFGIHFPLNKKTAPEIWHKTGEKLAKKGYDAIALLDKMNVRILCTSADPADDLEWHLRCTHSPKSPFRVVPSFDPDRFMNINKPEWFTAIMQLGKRYGTVHDWESLKSALCKSLDFFWEAGCRTACCPQEAEITSASPDAVIEKVIHYGTVSDAEAEIFKSVLYQFLLDEYKKRDLKVLSEKEIREAKDIDRLMESGTLSGSVGVVTDSRSFTSFVRHEYYRRILCDKIGQLVESGQYPDDMEFLGEMVRDICWRNAVAYFGLEV